MPDLTLKEAHEKAFAETQSMLPHADSDAVELYLVKMHFLGFRLLPKEATEEMWTAGRDPILARDCVTRNWSLGQHLDSIRNPGWATENERSRQHMSKGDAAAVVWRAMAAAFEEK